MITIEHNEHGSSVYGISSVEIAATYDQVSRGLANYVTRYHWVTDYALGEYPPHYPVPALDRQGRWCKDYYWRWFEAIYD